MASSSHRGIQIGSAWFQRKINLRPQHRGVHLVTEEILRQMPEIGQFSVGLCHVQSKYFGCISGISLLFYRESISYLSSSSPSDVSLKENEFCVGVQCWKRGFPLYLFRDSKIGVERVFSKLSFHFEFHEFHSESLMDEGIAFLSFHSYIIYCGTMK
jgi:hypothetical protein